MILRDGTKKVAQKYGTQSLSRSCSPPELPNANDEKITSISGRSTPSNRVCPNPNETELQAFVCETSPGRSLSPCIKAVSAAAFTQAFEGSVYMDYIPSLLASKEWSPALQQCFEAASLMYFSQSNPKLRLLTQAQAAFSNAVQDVNEALSRDHATDSDSLLASVMLLALYATFSPASSQNLSEWSIHFEGAITLLSKRSPDSYSSRHTQNVLSHVLSFGAMHVFRSKQQMPARFVKLLKYSVQMKQPIQIDFWHIIAAIADLQHMLDTNNYQPLNVALQAQAIDQQLEMLYNAIVYFNEHEDIRKSYGLCGQYPSVRQFQSLNTLRIGRMKLNGIIHSQINLYIKLNTYGAGWNCDRLTTLAQDAVQIANSMVEQIHHSIPETLQPSCQNPQYPSNSNAWICSFVWPLMEILNSRIISEEWKDKIRTQLVKFAKISDNNVVSNMALESARGTCPYQRYVISLL